MGGGTHKDWKKNTCIVKENNVLSGKKTKGKRCIILAVVTILRMVI